MVLTMAASMVLLAFIGAFSPSAEAQNDPFYIIYGVITLPNGEPVPDGTKYYARNLDILSDPGVSYDDKYMHNETYSTNFGEGIYKVPLHSEDLPSSENSLLFRDGDRIRINCSYNGYSITEVHTVDMDKHQGDIQIDLVLEKDADSASNGGDDAWYQNTATVVGIILISALAVFTVIYLFVPPREES